MIAGQKLARAANKDRRGRRGTSASAPVSEAAWRSAGLPPRQGWNRPGHLLATTSALALVLALMPEPVAAQTSWTGGAGNGDWTNAGNWSAGVPTASIEARIDNSTNNPVLITAPGAVAGTTQVPRTGTGTSLSIQGGGTLTSSGYVRIGDLAGSSGTATVTGAGSTWTANFSGSDNSFVIGAIGTGVLNITSGGSVVVTQDTVLGRAATGNGTLNISSGGSLETTTLSKMAGTAQVNINGGIIRAHANSASFISGFTGTEFNIQSGGLTVDSQAFNVTASSPLTGAGGLSKTGTGTLTLTGTSSFSGLLNVNQGTLALGNGGSISAGETRVGSNVSGANGTLTISNGTLTTNGRATVGGLQSPANYGTGLVTVDGSAGAAQWTITGALFLGYQGNNATTQASSGTLTISNGGVVTVGGALAVGDLNFATGTLNVQSGGQLTSTGEAHIGNFNAGAVGHATVTGAGSHWIINGAGGLNVGRRATGTLTIDNGGLVTSQNGTTVSTEMGGGGTLSVNGGAGGSGVLETLSLARGTGSGAAQVTFDGGTLRAVADNTTNFIGGFTGTEFNIAAGGMTVDTSGFNVGTTAANVLSGTGALTKIGAGTLTLNGANTFSGGLNINAGTVTAGIANAFGSGPLAVGTGATANLNNFAQTVSGLSGAGAVTLGSATLTDNQAGDTTYSGVMSGTGGLVKSGAGTLTLSGANAFSGGLTVGGGTVTAGSATAFGTGVLTVDSGTANFNNNSMTLAGLAGTGGTVALGSGTLTLNQAGTSSYAGAVTGTGGLVKAGAGTLTLSDGSNSFSGGLTVNAGAVAAGASSSAFGSGTLTVASGATANLASFDTTVNGLAGAGSIALGTATLTANIATASAFGGVVSGTGGLTKSGAGTLTLTGANSYAGATTVSAGTLLVNGDQSTATGATTVANGATLSGSGTLGGNVSVASGGTLLSQSNGTGDYNLTIRGDLSLVSGSNLNYVYGTSPNVDHDALMIEVDGNLALNGATLNVSNTSGTAFEAGIYGLVQYAGTMSGTLTPGTVPAGMAVQTAVAGRINLVNTAGLTLNFWDATGTPNDGAIQGGNGTWTAAPGNANWADTTGALNGAYDQNSFAVFAGTAGTVTVDNGAGAIGVSGMQFAADGYTITSGTITLNGTSASIVVGDRTGGTIYTATIDSQLTGSARLVKEDIGVLVLGNAANNYSGGTLIDDGTIRIAQDAALGTGALTFDGGTLQNTAAIASMTRAVTIEAGGGTFRTDADLTLASTVDGTGALTKTGAGTLTLTGTNSYSGGTRLDAGIVSVSAANNLGTGGLTFNGGTLHNTATFTFAQAVTVNAGGGTFQTDDDLALSGAITGAGALGKTGVGDLILTANSSYSGTLTVSGGNLEFGSGGAGGSIAGNVHLTNAGNGLIFDRSDNFSYGGAISGAGTVTQEGGGTTTLTSATSSYSGGTFLNGGVLAVSADGNLGATTGGLTFNGGTLQNTASFTLNASRAVTLNAGGGTFQTDASATLTLAGAVGGTGALTKTGAGTLTLTGTTNTYSGGTVINAGIVSVSADGNLGATSGGLIFNGGTLESTAGFSTARAVTLNAAGGTLQTDAGTLTLTGTIGGTGALTKTGGGTLALSGTNNYAGGTNLDAGTVSVSAAGNLGTGALAFNGGTLQNTAAFTLANAVTVNAGGGTFQTDQTLTLSGAITGAGTLSKTGAGDLILIASSSYSGTLTVSDGNLQFGAGGSSGSIAGNVALTNASNGLVFDRADAFTYGGTISGAGTVTQQGSGTATLTGSNSYTGATTIAAGTLDIDGNQSLATGLTTVQNGGILRGNGIIGGSVAVQSGGALTSFDDNADGINKLTINGNLGLTAGAQLNYSYGLSPNNDRDSLMVEVGGNVDLGGATLNVANPSGVAFDPGVYGLLHYSGALSGSLALGSMPSNDFSIQTAVAGRVNMVNTAGMNLQFWDGSNTVGDGSIHGGTGVWQGAGGPQNWTSPDGATNGSFANGAFAIFAGTASTVTVDSTTYGAVNVAGMQFTSDNYVITGQAITLTPASGTNSVSIVLGDRTPNGAEYVATIQSVLQGSARLVKEDLGTLILSGVNTYTGGTTIEAGTLQISQDANLGAAGTDLTIEGGTLQNTAAFSSARPVTLGLGDGAFQTDADLTLTGVVGGTGALIKLGDGMLTLAGTNTYAGGTFIEAGIVSVSSDANLGAASGGITLDGATLQNTAAFSSARPVTLEFSGGTFQTLADLALTGAITGPGGLTKTGSGKLSLDAANTYTGPTAVNSGTLAVNGSITSTVTVAAAGTLGGNGTIFGNVDNFGTIAPGNSIGTLTIAGNYVGHGGRYLAEAILGADNSPADKLVISGGTASGSTAVQVINLNGAGALTTGNGIPIVVTTNGGTTTSGAFSLAGPVAAGPYEYLLFRGSQDASGPDNWYLRSHDTNPTPPGPGPQPQPTPPTPLYRPEAPAYAAVPGMARRLNQALLGSFHERVGDQALLAGGGWLPGAWGRWIGQKSEMSHGGALAPHFDGTIAGLQTGLDLYGFERPGYGQDRFGVFFAYGRSLGDITGFALGQQGYKAGKMDLSGYAIGGTWTHIAPSGWYVDAVLMGTKYDADPRSNRGLGAKVEGYGVTASLEGGYPLALGRGVTLEPQAQLIFQHLQLDSTFDRFSSIAYDTPAALSGRLGLRLAGAFQAGSAVLRPYVTANLWQEFLGADKTIFSGTALSSGGRDATSVEIAGGVAAQLTQSVGLWGNVSYLTDIAGPERQAWRGNIGVRVTW